MTDATQPEHQLLVAAALDDWWIRTDPARPFHAPEVAHHLDTYLADLGYQIGPAVPHPPADTHRPTRSYITVSVAVTLAAAAATIGAALHGHPWWAVAGGGVTIALALDTALDIVRRRDTDRP